MLQLNFSIFFFFKLKRKHSLWLQQNVWCTAKLTGSIPPGTVWLLADQSTAEFVSDYTVNPSGFSATYRAANTSNLSGTLTATSEWTAEIRQLNQTGAVVVHFRWAEAVVHLWARHVFLEAEYRQSSRLGSSQRTHLSSSDRPKWRPHTRKWNWWV